MKASEIMDLGYSDQQAGKVNQAWYQQIIGTAGFLYRSGCRAARQDAFYKRLEEQAERSRRLARLMSLDDEGPSYDK